MPVKAQLSCPGVPCEPRVLCWLRLVEDQIDARVIKCL